MNQQEALDRLVMYLRPDDDPTLTTTEVELLLESNARAVDADGLAPDDDAWTPTYSVVGVYKAAGEGWKVKAGAAAGRFDFTTDGQTFRRSQIIDHCEASASRYLRLCNQTVTTSGA